MELIEMYEMHEGMTNSPVTHLSAPISATDTTIPLLDTSVFPDAPNLATLGFGEDAETIRYSEKTDNELRGVTRGFQSVGKAWLGGTPVARMFTAYDLNALIANITGINVNIPAVNNTLTSTSTTVALSADQGRLLNTNKLERILRPPQAGIAANFAESRSLASFYDARVSNVGMIKITLPYSWTNTTHHIVIRGYDYRGLGAAWELIIGGYNRSANPSWVNTGAICTTGNMPNDIVRFAHDGANCCIILGSASSLWSVTSVSVEAAITAAAIPAALTGHTVSIITTEAGITFSGGEFYANTPPQNTILRPTWENATLQSGWAHHTAIPLRYCKINGAVFIRGVITGALVANATMFTIPPEFRPLFPNTFIGVGTSGAANFNATVLANGAAQPMTGFSAPSATYHISAMYIAEN